MDDKSLVDSATFSFFAMGAFVGFSLGYCYWKSQPVENQQQSDEQPITEVRLIKFCITISTTIYNFMFFSPSLAVKCTA